MLEFLLFSVSVPEGLIARFHMTIHIFLFYALFFFIADLLRLTKTSSGDIRDKTQCEINKIMMGEVCY